MERCTYSNLYQSFQVANRRKDEVHRSLSKFKGNKAIVFTGKVPEDLGILFKWGSYMFHTFSSLGLYIPKPYVDRGINKVPHGLKPHGKRRNTINNTS